MQYNDIDAVANGMISCYFSDYGIFDTMDIYKNVTKADIEKRLFEVMDEKYSALSVVKSK